MIQENEYYEINVPVWRGFKYIARLVVYERTPEMQRAARKYVESVINSPINFSSWEGDKYKKYFVWPAIKLREAITTANDNIKPNSNVAKNIFDEECFVAAGAIGKEAEMRFLEASRRVHGVLPRHDLPQRSSSLAITIGGTKYAYKYDR